MRFSTASCSAASIRSEAHVPAVLLPQPAHRGFGDARLVRLDRAPAHLDHRRLRRSALHAALHESGRGAVLQRNVSCRADEVRLPHAQLVHLRVVRRVAEAGPHELGAAYSLRQHLSHGEAVHDLLQYEPRKHGEDLQRDTVADLVDRLEHLRRLQRVAAARRAHTGALVLVTGLVRLHHGEARVAAAFAADDDPALLLQAVKAESRKEKVQEARVVGVLHVLEVELPVALQHLAIAAEDLHGFLHHAADSRRDLGTDVAFDRRRRLRERREHQAAEDLDAEFSRRMAPRVGVPGHAAFALDATAERDRSEVAPQVVGPVVIDAGDLFRVAAVRETQERTAVRAAVFEAADGTGFVPRRYHRHLARERGLEISLLRQLGLKAEEIPGVAAVDAFLLPGVDFFVLVDPVGNAGEAFGRPGAGFGDRGHGNISYLEIRS